MRMRGINMPNKSSGRIRGGLLLLLGLLALSLAWLIPAPFRGWAPDVLAHKGADGEQPEQRIGWLLDQGATAAAARMLQFYPQARNAAAQAATDAGLEPGLRPVEPFLADAEARLQALAQEFPALRLSGLPDPFIESFLQASGLESRDFASPPPVARTLASASARNRLAAYLQTSSNTTVQQLLALREVGGWKRFGPVFTATGAPLDTAVLTTALLVQGGHWQPPVARWIRAEAEAAADGSPQALARLEAFFLAVLAYADSNSWGGLAALAGSMQSWEQWVQAASLWREHQEYNNDLYALLLFTGNPAKLIGYLMEHGDAGWQAVAAAWYMGADSLDTLIGSGYLLHKDPLGVYRSGWMPSGIREQTALWTASHTRLFIALRMGLCFFAGFCLMAGFASLTRSRSDPSGPTWVGVVRDAAGGGLLLLVVLLVTEPDLMSQPVSEPGKLFLEFEIAPRDARGDTETMPDIVIDQITLLVLLIFFVIQLVLYGICLIKLSQVKRAPVPAYLKIRLLENEENLFDSGLYVGLGGTVVALLALAMGVVQASLVAAYASTLFGIVFVAVVKIIHLRPMRKRLILEAERHIG